MKMSTKGRYAVRILLSIASHQKNGPVPKKVISDEESISTDYIEQIIVPLKNEGFVVGVRGIKGGFQLTRKPSQITIFDVLRASEGNLKLVDCAHLDCRGRDKNKCAARHVWAGAYEVLKDYFSKITLQDLLDRAAEYEQSGKVSYNI